MVDDEYNEQIGAQNAQREQQDQQCLDGVNEADVLEQRRVARMAAAGVAERWGIRPFARL